MVAGVANGTRDSQKLQESTVVIRLFQRLTLPEIFCYWLSVCFHS